ncbi:hypothetical protein MKW98_021014 [Papaver atlanticum]|uniref:Uncharacterized protein n=1 Tax=Papaver atlanticum TaxID=357466 RepID=A0AAD4XI32_9MAGN|nr:hypothetical protein MKW98_021014 [Papaver atlanticum]
MNRCSKSSARVIGRYFKLFQRAAYPLLSHSCCKFHCSRGPNKWTIKVRQEKFELSREEINQRSNAWRNW